MAKKVVMMQKVSGVLETFYPKTTAEQVIMNSGESVEEVLSALVQKINLWESKLDFDTVYMKTDAGVLLDDGSGNNLVAVY